MLYRLGAQSQSLIEAFQRSGIPYQTAGQASLYETPEVRGVLAYLWLVYNSDSAFHLEQVLQFKKREQFIQLLDLATEQQRRLGEVLEDFERLGIFSPAQKKLLKKLVPFLQELRGAAEPIIELIERVQQFMSQALKQPLDEPGVERLAQLRLRAVPFGPNLGEFLEATVLQKETDLYDPRADRVALLTLHSAKGLEFPTVFIVGCEEGILPYQRQGEPADIEEERRLFYVGMTRAQQKLILTHARSRFLFGRKQQNEPSRFLKDIEETLKELKEMAARKVKKKDEAVQLTLF